MWTASSSDRHLCFLPRERERKKRKEKDNVPLTLPHFYCRKSGSANALVTRRFPVTCCPRPMSPRVSLPRPRGVHERAEPVPARSGRPLFLAGVPVAPFLDMLESALQTFGKSSRIRNPFSDKLSTLILSICQFYMLLVHSLLFSRSIKS